MKRFEAFLDALQNAGVHIEGRDRLIMILSQHEAAWTAAAAACALTGPKHGIRFVRAAAQEPSDAVLDDLLRAYDFRRAERERFVQNVQ